MTGGFRFRGDRSAGWADQLLGVVRQMIELDGMPLDSLRVLPVPLEEFPPDGMLGRRAGTERAHL